MKAAIIILSDPKNGGEDALGRMFNGLAAAYDFKQRGTDVSIYFQGAGTRWPGVKPGAMLSTTSPTASWPGNPCGHGNVQ